MKPEQFLVKVAVKGKERSQLWEPTIPLGLGSPIRWVLERNPGGVFLRDVTGKVHEISKDGLIQVDKNTLANGETIDLPGGPGKPPIKVSIHKLRPIPPAFASAVDKDASASLSQLFAFAGVLRTVVGAQAVHSAYVAYAKGRPVFTAYRNAEGYKVKPLINGVHLKFKGEEPSTRPVGESWQIAEDELLNATVTRGRYWWRFNLVKVASRVHVEREIVDEESKKFKMALRTMLMLLVALFLFTIFSPEATKPPEPEPPAPTVKFKVKPREPNQFLAQQTKPANKTPVIVKSSEKDPAVAAKPMPQPAPQIAEANEAPKAAAPSHKEGPPKSKPSHIGSRTKPILTQKTPTSPKIPPEVLREKQAAQAAAARAKALREALGGAALALAQKDVSNTSATSPSLTDNSGAKNSDLAPTEVRAGAMTSSVKVGTIGGKNGGKEGGVGYEVGEHAKLKGQGGSFVSMSTNDSVVDEGLTKEEVGIVIHAHMGEVRYCHEASMLSNPKLEGKLVLQFGISPRGVVEVVSVQSTTLPERKLGDCVIARLKTWQFPRPKGGIHVSVSYPFIFKTLGKE